MNLCPTEKLEAVEDEQAAPKVLIIDDDIDAVEVLSAGLMRQGYQTMTASDGHSGMELAESEHPRLVLLDVALPDADGLQLCQRLSDDPKMAGTPVIIVSGTERKDIIRQSRAAGCQYFVRKPYDPNALLVLIDQAISEADGTAFE